jgi:hydroxymethylpyrimidine pyrophosphatase-like HAD family hydrolase
LSSTYRGMLVSDLDGTLLRDGRRIGGAEWRMLIGLGRRRILRVIATGRSLYSARQVLGDDTPIDYLIISSGAGTMQWRTGELIQEHSMEPSQVEAAFIHLRELGLDFMIHDPLPDNHRFTYFSRGSSGGRDDSPAGGNPDFHRRIAYYRPFAAEGRIDGFLSPRDGGGSAVREACQFIAIHPGDVTPGGMDGGDTPPGARRHHYYRQLKRRLPGLTVIRTTSPMDGRSVWLEIFPPAVSKSKAAERVRALYGIDPGRTLALGNDYNDEDMLAWAARAYVVDTAPLHLRRRYGLPGAASEGPGRIADRLVDAVERWFSG